MHKTLHVSTCSTRLNPNDNSTRSTRLSLRKQLSVCSVYSVVENKTCNSTVGE